MYLEVLQDMKEMKEMKERKEMDDRKVIPEEVERERGDIRKMSILQNYQNLQNEEIKESDNEMSPIPFNSKDEDGDDITSDSKKAEGSPRISDIKKESSDIEERKRMRFENNLKFLKNMNFIAQDTPRHSCLDYNPNNFTAGLNNFLDKENSANKNHANANIKRPVARKSSIGIINNLNSISLLFRNMKKNPDNINFSSTFANLNNTLNNNDGSLIETKPFLLNDTKLADTDKSDKLPTYALSSVNNIAGALAGSFMNKEKQHSMVPKALHYLKESIISTMGLSNQTQMYNELKKTKKELELYKTTVTNLSDELLYLKSHNLQIDKIISEFQESQKKILECEIDNFNHILRIYKCLYEEEVRSKRKVIEELAKIVDEVYVNSVYKNQETIESPKLHQRPQSMTFPNSGNIFSNYINTNSFIHSTGNTRNRAVVYDYLKYKKDKILNYDSAELDGSNSVMKIAEAILHDGGTATKKLDYILFQIENNFDELRVEFGSGLHGNIPSKSPLFRNLKLSLVGDTTSDVESPEATD